jgi:hypothetical protein
MADATIQRALAMGVPTLAVLVGALINNSRLNVFADIWTRVLTRCGTCGVRKLDKTPAITVKLIIEVRRFYFDHNATTPVSQSVL